MIFDKCVCLIHVYQFIGEMCVNIFMRIKINPPVASAITRNRTLHHFQGLTVRQKLGGGERFGPYIAVVTGLVSSARCWWSSSGFQLRLLP